MESYIHKYLTRHYELSSSEEASKKLRLVITYGIYPIHNESAWGRQEIHNVDLLDELEKVFGISELKAKAFVNNWAKSINKQVKLNEYWSKIKSLMPMAMKVMAQTMAFDLLPVRPMDAPMAMGSIILDDLNVPKKTPRIYSVDDIHKEIVEERVRQSWAPILDVEIPEWQREKLMRLMENQRIFVSSRKKEE